MSGKLRKNSIEIFLRGLLILGGCFVLTGCTAGNENAGAEMGSKPVETADLTNSADRVTGKEESPAEGEGPVSEQDGLVTSLAAAVTVMAGGNQGSGVLYETTDDGLIFVTAGHVISPGIQEASVFFQDGEEILCSRISVSSEADCAFLAADKEFLPADWKERYAPVYRDRDIFDALESGKGVFVADSQADNGLGCRFAMVVESWSYVEDFGQHMMLLSGEAQAGMSGSGVFDENGCFLGILCGGNEEGELAVLPYSIVETNLTEAWDSSNRNQRR